MGLRGAAPAPLAKVIAEGNPNRRSKDELNVTQPTPELSDNHQAPGHLVPEAQREFEKLKELLYKNSLLSEIDGYQLSILAQAWGRWVEVDRMINQTAILLKNSKGDPIINPLFKESIKLMEVITRNLAAFGMSPSSRSRINLADKKEDDEEDAWERLVRQRAELKKKHLVKDES